MGGIKIAAHAVMKCCSGSRPHVHMGSTVSLKLCRNLCSFKRLKFNLRRLNSLIPLVSSISKTEFPLGLIKLRIVILSLLIDLIFLVLSLSLLHPLMHYGKNEFSNTLVLAGIGLILFCC